MKKFIKEEKIANRVIYAALILSATLLTSKVYANDHIKELVFIQENKVIEAEIIHFKSNCVTPESIRIEMSNYLKYLKKKNYQFITISPLSRSFSKDSYCIFTFAKK